MPELVLKCGRSTARVLIDWKSTWLVAEQSSIDKTRQKLQTAGKFSSARNLPWSSLKVAKNDSRFKIQFIEAPKR
jgi:hypothetical protein